MWDRIYVIFKVILCVTVFMWMVHGVNDYIMNIKNDTLRVLAVLGVLTIFLLAVLL